MFNFKREEGFVFAATTIVLSIAIGLSLLYLNNSVSLNITRASEQYTTIQSYWNAISGVEYAIQKIQGGLSGGTFSFYNGTVNISLSTLDLLGIPLPSNQTRIISKGVVGESERLIQFYYSSEPQAFSYAAFVDTINTAGNTTIVINKKSKVNGEMVINNANVDTISGAQMGASNVGSGNPVILYVAAGKLVNGLAPPQVFSPTFESRIYPGPIAKFPTFDTSFYDSLLAIAEAITSTSGNKNLGNFNINSAFDLSTYADNTLFIKGELNITTKNGEVAAQSVDNPGFFVVTDIVSITAGAKINDNVIIISAGKIDIGGKKTLVGEDHTALAYEDWPPRVNELFSKTEIEVASGASTFANIYSMGTVQLRAIVYARVFCKGAADFTNSEFKGGFICKSVSNDLFENSALDLLVIPPSSATDAFTSEIIAGTWKEI